MHVGIPYAPVSPPYSLVSTDFGKLRYVLGLLTPGLVFISDGTKYARAIAAAVPGTISRWSPSIRRFPAAPRLRSPRSKQRR